jgi:RNA-directed DNA polymerase
VPVSEETKQTTEAERLRERYRWAEASVWTDRMLAALENGVKGGKWFSLMDKVYARRTLESAWRSVRANQGAAGVDQMSVERFAAQAEQYLTELHEALKAGTYRPDGVRRTYIPKAGGGQRPLGIPTVKDRVVQGALKRVIEPIFEREFLPMSYGFRPRRRAHEALREVDGLLAEGYTWVVDADLKSYFDTIPHERLMAAVARRISDGRVLTLLRAYLSQSILEPLKEWKPTTGTPQGAVLSPLLANLYLHGLDEQISARYRMVRYADDFVVLCRTQAEAAAALAEIREWTEGNGLTLHPEKTHVGDCRQPGQGFEFLGYRFEGGRRYVRRKSLKALREKIRQKTRRQNGHSLQRIIAEVNPILRGWFTYFKHARSSTFRPVDGFVRRRLRALLRKRDKRPGFGATYHDHLRWPNAYFMQRGLFTLATAHAAVRRSR